MGEREGSDARAEQLLDEQAGHASEGMAAAWREANAALLDTERRYRELVEYSLGLICIHDLEGTILSINPAAAEALGYRPEDGIGRNIRDFLSPAKQPLFGEYLQRIARAGNDAGLMSLLTRAGAQRIWMYRNVLTHDRSGSPYVLGHALDITDRIAVERTLRESEQALLVAHADLEARVRARTTELEEANARLRKEIREREEAEQSRERALIEQRDTLAFLSTFSDRLTPVLTFDELFEVACRLPVPFLADWTMVHAVNDDGTVRCVPGVHADPASRPVLAALGTPSGGVSPASHLARAMTTGSMAILDSTSDELATTFAGPEGPVAAFRQLGMKAAALLPLASRGGVKAVLSLVSQREDRFGPSRALVVGEVARRLRLALERIELYRDAQEANRVKEEFLGTLSHELRTPLNAIFGWTRMLRARTLDEHTAWR